MTVSPRTPPGVLELLPREQIAHQRMLDTIRRGFERFGFVPVETPVFELTNVLLTKSGGETEKQVYFVQSTGSLGKGLADGEKPELALRFDLTVPLARYVAEHEHDLNFPFRRYQIQRVYRGERAQKGRYREFYQCDIDVIGKDTLSLAYDAEMPAVIHGIFQELGIGKFTIKINNRKLLRGLLESLGIAVEQHAAVLHEVDRLGKLSRDEVSQRLAPLGAAGVLDKLDGGFDALAGHVETAGNAALTEGYRELGEVRAGLRALGVPEDDVRVDLSIARGLDYYTGTVYETFLDAHPELGSICSGGRYENLAGHYTKSKLPGVGISIGATRLFSKLLELKLLGAEQASTAHVMVLQVEAELAPSYSQIATELRTAGLNVELYASADKLAKQLKYADRAGVPLAILYGSRERDAGIVKVKDLRPNAEPREHDVPRADLVERVRSLVHTR